MAIKKKKIGIIAFITLISILVTLLIASTISIGGGSSEWDDLWNGGLQYYYGTSSGYRYGFAVNDVTAARYNNIYCIEYGDVLRSGYAKLPYTSVDACRFYVRGIVELSNGQAKVTYYPDDEWGWDYNDPSWSQHEKSLNSGEHNYILAAILYGIGDEDRGMWTGDGSGMNYTNQQKALYYYWNTWVSLSGLSSSFSHSSNPNAGSYSSFSTYEQKAKTTNHDVKFYLLKPSDDSDYQDLLVARRFGTSTRNTNITVTKKWSDENDKYNNRPNSITASIYQNGTDTGTNVTLYKSENWTKTISVSPGTGYSAVEDEEPAGYTSSNNGLTITNTLETTSITVTKKWEDDNNKDGNRPSQITLSISGNGTYIKDVTMSGDSSSDEWTEDISGLPAYINGTAVEKYTVSEKSERGYTPTTTYDENDNKKIYVTNAYEPETTQVTVKKVWADSNDNDGMRPDSVNVIITANGINETITVQLSEENNWTYTWSNIKKYKNGDLVTFTVQENDVEGYSKEIKETNTNEFTITNTHNIHTTSIKVTKKWEDDGNSDGKRPSQITLSVYGDGKFIKDVTISGNSTSDEWSQEILDLPKFINGNAVQKYTVSENSNSGYTPTVNYDTNDSKKVYITNAYEFETTQVTVKKIWSDSNNNDGIRPSAVNVIITASGVNESKSVQLSEANNWTYTWSNVRKYKDRNLVTFTVQESDVAGYTKQIQQTNTNEFTITNSHSLEKININVVKEWEDENNIEGKRPNSVTARLLSNGADTGKTISLGTNNNWRGQFTNLNKYKNGQQINYTIQEIVINDDYVSSVTGNMSTGFTIVNTLKNGSILTNTHEPQRVEVTVEKKWDDEDDFDELRTQSVEVTLYADNEKVAVNADGEDIDNPIRLSDLNGWKYTFTDLFKYRHEGILINYSVVETPVYTNKNDRKEYLYNNPNNQPGYSPSYQPATSTQQAYDYTDYKITVTNTHVPHYEGYIEISGTVWYDGDGGKANEVNGLLNGSAVEQKLSGYTVRLIDGTNNDINLKCSYYSGKGNNITYCGTEYATTDANGDYTIRVNYVNSENAYSIYENKDNVIDTDDASRVKEDLKNAYVQFEYDGMTYTTVANINNQESNTSNATENGDQRENFDKVHSNIIPSTKHPNEWTDRTFTANTSDMAQYSETFEDRYENIKYCDGNGTLYHTKYDDNRIINVNRNYGCANCPKTGHVLKEHQVKVIKYENINLGLFKREQPEVALFTDITDVKLKMNGQEYTYKYGVRATTIDNTSGVLAKFQNKETYTYRRPVNPADIAYIRDNPTGPDGKDRMEVYVTYEIRVANLASTLNLEIDNIRYYFDSNYELANSTHNWSINGGTATNTNELNIKLKAGEETGQDKATKPIEVTFKVNYNMLRDLFNNKPPLNFAAEIESYISTYGKDTLYAQQGKGGRTGDAYGGYDYDSHPGNAGIFINSNGRLEATNKEDDTDIAPAFVLEPKVEALKTLGGTVWEDGQTNTVTVDHTIHDKERLGNGYIDGDEKFVKNVKVEIYDLETGNKAIRYDENGTLITSDVYTDGNGYYNLEGVVTGEYYVKYTYGNYHEDYPETTKAEDKTETADVKLENPTTIMEGNGTTEIVEVNGRNYKSTIVTDPKIKAIMGMNYSDGGYDKTWHINHTDGYTVAVDNMIDRLNMTNLRNENYDYGVNITAFTKPFKTLVEFETSGNSNVTNEVKTEAEGNVVTGDINVSNQLDRLDFGIIERPQEDLILHKTISYFKITLANGQVLTQGDPRDVSTNIKYAKQIGFRKFNESDLETVESLRNAVPKTLLVEVDAELIQGATLDVTYEVRAANNNEIDYDYGNVGNYGDIVEKSEAGSGNGDKYITKSEWASYYYYGNIGILNEIETELAYVDYASEELVPDTISNSDTWKGIKATELEEKGYISQDTLKAIQQNEYRVLRTREEGEAAENNEVIRKIQLRRGISTQPVFMKVSRVLSNKHENVLHNNVEIIEIDSKTARTIKAVINEESGYDRLDYKPGNYQPGISGLRDESDEDGVDLLITPPTGITNNITKHMIIALVGLTIVFVVVIFIKKKILTK